LTTFLTGRFAPIIGMPATRGTASGVAAVVTAEAVDHFAGTTKAWQVLRAWAATVGTTDE
jgi:hypothetical protein